MGEANLISTSDGLKVWEVSGERGDVSLTGVSVLVIDDHAVFAEALSSALMTRAGAAIVEVADTVERGLAALMAAQPDLVVLDVRVGLEDGLLLLDRLAELSPGSRVVVLTGHPRPDVYRRAAARGASVISKGSGLDELLDELAAAAGRPTGAPVAAPTRSDCQVAAALSTREAQVLQLLASGQDVSQVARRLGLSPHTVRDHVRSARTKFGVPTQLAAVMEGMRQGEIEFPA